MDREININQFSYHTRKQQIWSRIYIALRNNPYHHEQPPVTYIFKPPPPRQLNRRSTSKVEIFLKNLHLPCTKPLFKTFGFLFIKTIKPNIKNLKS
jgi:hypothetical protein